MTTSFGVNITANDIYLGADGNLVVNTGQLAVESACQNVSQFRLGEAVLQTGMGLPMMQTIFSGTPNPAAYENALRTNLEAVDGVVQVTVINLNATGNTFSYTATIESAYGQTFQLNG